MGAHVAIFLLSLDVSTSLCHSSRVQNAQVGATQFSCRNAELLHLHKFCVKEKQETDIRILHLNMQSKQQPDKEQRRARVSKRLMDMQFAPVKSLPMTLFMLWMVGNDVSIFSIMFVGMAVMNPITSLLNTNQTFEPFEENVREDSQLRGSVTQAKLIYAACCVAAFVVGLLKLSWMGLMPVSAVDWMDHRPPQLSKFSQGSAF